MLWEQWRHEGLTSSDACAAAGQSTRRTPRQVANAKRRELVIESRPPSEDMLWGDIMEPSVASEACRRMGLTLARGSVSNWVTLVGPRSKPWVYNDSNMRFRETVESTLEPLVRSTPDYIALDENRRPVIVECKTTGQDKRWRNGIPLNVQWQVQWHMLAADIPRAIVPVLFYKNTRTLRVWKLERLPDFEPGGPISRWARAWWDRHVVAGEPVPVQAGDIRDLTAENPNGDGKTVDLPSSAARLDTLFVEAFRERSKAAALLKSCTAKQKAIEASLRQLIGPASFGKIGDATYSLFSASRGGRILRRNPKP